LRAIRALKEATHEPPSQFRTTWCKDITLFITESNPKLLDAFADLTLVIERGEIESHASN
jgi:hypothetical protein